jgi:hypothetical protein
MHRVDVLTEGVAHAEHRHVIVVIPAAVDQKARWLVHDHQVQIDEQDFDG